jgi:hypothetical protein
MKLLIRSRSGSRVCDWQSYALLRDNVQHFLEDGQPGDRFPALHDVEHAVEGDPQVIDAARLRGELLRAWCALWKVRLESSAISLRTRAILTGNRELPLARGTVPAGRVGWQLPLTGNAIEPVPQVARRFIRSVLVLTDAAVDGDVLEVRCLERGEGISRVRESRRISKTKRLSS